MNLALKKIEQRLDTLLHKNGLGASDTLSNFANVPITWKSIWGRATQLENDYRNDYRNADRRYNEDWYTEHQGTTNGIALWVRANTGDYPSTKAWAENWLSGSVALLTGIEGLTTALKKDGLNTLYPDNEYYKLYTGNPFDYDLEGPKTYDEWKFIFKDGKKTMREAETYEILRDVSNKEVITVKHRTQYPECMWPIVAFKITDRPDNREFVVKLLHGEDHVELAYYQDGTKYHEDLHYKPLTYIERIKSFFP
jgi:hypothetical protein